MKTLTIFALLLAGLVFAEEMTPDSSKKLVLSVYLDAKAEQKNGKWTIKHFSSSEKTENDAWLEAAKICAKAIVKDNLGVVWAREGDKGWYIFALALVPDKDEKPERGYLFNRRKDVEFVKTENQAWFDAFHYIRTHKECQHPEYYKYFEDFK